MNKIKTALGTEYQVVGIGGKAFYCKNNKGEVIRLQRTNLMCSEKDILESYMDYVKSSDKNIKASMNDSSLSRMRRETTPTRLRRVFRVEDAVLPIGLDDEEDMECCNNGFRICPEDAGWSVPEEDCSNINLHLREL